MTSFELVPIAEVLPPMASRARDTATRRARPLSIHLTIHTLDRIARDLVPFYGEDCPVAVVYDEQDPANEIIQATLATVSNWVDSVAGKRPVRVFVG